MWEAASLRAILKDRRKSRPRNAASHIDRSLNRVWMLPIQNPKFSPT